METGCPRQASYLEVLKESKVRRDVINRHLGSKLYTRQTMRQSSNEHVSDIDEDITLPLPFRPSMLNLPEPSHLLVKRSWDLVYDRREQIGIEFLTRVFDERPDIMDHFSFAATNQHVSDRNDLNRKCLVAHALVVMNTIGNCVDNLRNIEELIPSLRALGERHRTRGLTADNLNVFLRHMLGAIGDSLGPEAWTNEVEDAWKSATNTIKTAMTRNVVFAARRTTNPKDFSSRNVVNRNESMMEMKELEDLYNELESRGGIVDPGHGSVPFYAFPNQRQRWGEDQILPHVNWGDLFFDLFYVAAAYNLGGMLIGALTPTKWFRGMVYYIAIFGGLFHIWETKMVYDARYTVVDYTHRIVEVIRICFLSLVVLNIKSFDLMTDPSSSELFFLSLGLLLETAVRMFLKLELVFVGEGNKEAIQNHSKKTLRQLYMPTFLFYLVATILAGTHYFRTMQSATKDNYDQHSSYSENDPYSLDDENDGHRFRWLAGTDASKDTSDVANQYIGWGQYDLPILFILLAYLWNSVFVVVKKMCTQQKDIDLRRVSIPINVDYSIHRYGEWVMLMLGESVLSLLIVPTSESPEYYVVVFLGILTVILIQTLHFESQPSSETDHALYRNSLSVTYFSINTQLYSMGLVAFGVSYKIMLTAIHDETQKSSYGDGHRARSLLTQYIRHLASSVKVSELAVSILFSSALSISLMTLEIMPLIHMGARANFSRIFNEGNVRWSVVTLKFFKIAILGAAATFSLWLNTGAYHIALGGFVCVAFLCVSRIVGWRIYSKEKSDLHHTYEMP